MAAARLSMTLRLPTVAAIATAVVLCVSPAAGAHVLSDTERSALSFGWSFEPWIVALLALSMGAYLIGYARLSRRSRGQARASGARRLRLLAFAGGWGALVFAFVSPLDTLSGALFSAHMVQHESMMLIAAPLCVAGRPLGVWIWALPQRGRRWAGRAVRASAFARAWRWLSAPLVAWLLHALALWAWHAPPLFEAALAYPPVHTLQHASFLVSALLFWWTVTGEGARRGNGGHAMLALFTTMVHTSALGALISLAPGVWYPSYVESCAALGIDPLHDQQLGGLIMWVPGAAAYLAGALLIAARWVARPDRRPALRRAMEHDTAQDAARAGGEGAR